jgi:hypothetical protein
VLRVCATSGAAAETITLPASVGAPAPQALLVSTQPACLQLSGVSAGRLADVLATDGVAVTPSAAFNGTATLNATLEWSCVNRTTTCAAHSAAALSFAVARVAVDLALDFDTVAAGTCRALPASALQVAASWSTLAARAVRVDVGVRGDANALLLCVAGACDTRASLALGAQNASAALALFAQSTALCAVGGAVGSNASLALNATVDALPGGAALGSVAPAAVAIVAPVSLQPGGDGSAFALGTAVTPVRIPLLLAVSDAVVNVSATRARARLVPTKRASAANGGAVFALRSVVCASSAAGAEVELVEQPGGVLESAWTAVDVLAAALDNCTAAYRDAESGFDELQVSVALDVPFVGAPASLSFASSANVTFVVELVRELNASWTNGADSGVPVLAVAGVWSAPLRVGWSSDGALACACACACVRRDAAHALAPRRCAGTSVAARVRR